MYTSGMIVSVIFPSGPITNKQALVQIMAQ